jgi:hypothetical protein
MPKDLAIEKIAPGKRLDVMLAEGEIPAMLSPTLPKRFIEGDKRIVRLFPDYKQVELDYYRTTGIFPIMHVTVIKQEIVDKHPWVAVNLTKAFEEAKNLAYRRMANPRMVPIAWVRTALEEQEEVLGNRPLGVWSDPRQPQESGDRAALHAPAGHDQPDAAAGRAIRGYRSRRCGRAGRDLTWMVQRAFALFRSHPAAPRLPGASPPVMVRSRKPRKTP